MATKSFELSQMANTLQVGTDETTVQYGHSGTFTGDLTVEGNFTVNGDTITITSTELAVQDNMIFLNTPSAATITSASGDGSTQTYTADNNYAIGYTVVITGMSPAGYNTTSATITGATSTSFTIAGSEQGTYVSGGSAIAKAIVNPDLGFIGEYNDGADKHAGLFRDATDGKFKFFDSYTPDPASSINTAHASFNLAPITAGAGNLESLLVKTSGTTTRLGELHVSNVSDFWTDLDGTDSAIVFKEAGGNSWRIGNKASGDRFNIVQDSASLSTNVRFTIANGGAVGIGTETPQSTSKLHVNKTLPTGTLHYDGFSTVIVTDTESRLQLMSTDGGTNAATLLLSNGAKHWGLHHHGPTGSNVFSIGYRTSAATGEDITNNLSDVFNITTGGNVGIGDIDPVSTLEISKSDQTNGTTLTITNAFNGSTWAVNDVIGTVDFRTDDASTTEPTRGRIQSITDNVLGTNWSYGTALTFSTAFNNTLSEVMRISSGGYVGIGTNSPGAALEIKDTWSSNHGQLTINNASGTYGGLTLQYQDTIKAFLYHENTLNVVSLIGATGQELAFHTDSSNGTNGERVRIDTSGQVGIGTNNPGYQLHLYGAQDGKLTLQVSSGDTSEWNYINFVGSDGVRDGYVGTDSTGNIQIYSDKNANGLYSASNHWYTNENFSVNTSNNHQTLTVYGNMYLRANDVITWSNGNGTLTVNTSYNMLFNTYDGVSATTEKMRITSSGNVGIGTNNPHSKLHVNGEVTIGTGIEQYEIDAVPATGAMLHVHKTADDGGDADGQVNFGDEAQVIISTGAVSGGGQGYQGSLWFGTSDHPAAGSTTNNSGGQFNWKVAGIASSTVQDTASSTTSYGTLEFYTKNGGSLTERMRITEAGLVGIGTTSPTSPLEVQSDTNVTLLLNYDPVTLGSSWTWQQFEAQGTSKWRIFGDSADNLAFVDTGGTYVLQLKQDNSVYLPAGPLKVGADSSTQYGDTTGTGSISLNPYTASNGTNIQISGNNNGWALMYMNRIDIGADMYNSNNRYFDFYADGTSKVRISGDSSGNLVNYMVGGGSWNVGNSSGSTIFTVLNGGNVGIGTNNPGAQLHIYETGVADGSINRQLLLDTQFAVASIDSNDRVSIGFSVTNSGGGNQTRDAIIYGYDDRLWLNTTGDAATTYIGSNGSYFVDEGTTHSKLSKISSISFGRGDGNGNWDSPEYHGIRSTEYDGNWGDDISINSYHNITLRVDSNANNGDGYVRIMNNTTGNATIHYFGHNGTRPIMACGGYLQVGDQSTPAYPIDVATNGGLTDTNKLRFGIYNGDAAGTTNYVGSGIVWAPKYTGYSKTSAGILQIGEGNYFRSGLAFYTNNTANQTTAMVERMRISMDGNVGIGISEPTNKFEVHGSAGQLFAVTDSMSGTIFEVNDSAGIPSIEVIDTGQITLAEFQGSVLIGSLTSNGSKLQVEGDITATGDVTAYASSDERLKENLEPITNALEKVNTLTGYTYNWNERARNKDHEIREAGVIAQQVAEVLPEVTTTRDDGYMAVNYERMVPLLIEAIKELKAEIEELKRK